MWMYTPQDGDWWQDKPASILEGERHRLSVTMTEDPAEANALAERIVSFLNAPTVAAQQCGRPEGLDATDMDMIRRGDMLGPALGARAAALIQSQAARIAELEAGLRIARKWMPAGHRNGLTATENMERDAVDALLNGKRKG